MNNHRLSAAERAKTEGNLRLASQFIRELLDAPEQFDALPEKATIVLLPPDEPENHELSTANVEMAKQLAAKGQHPILWSVGQSTPKRKRALA